MHSNNGKKPAKRSRKEQDKENNKKPRETGKPWYLQTFPRSFFFSNSSFPSNLSFDSSLVPPPERKHDEGRNNSRQRREGVAWSPSP
jgi:hypothetical protein